MLCLEAGETPKLKLLNARCFLSASAHECLVEDPVLSIPPDPARLPLLTVLICRVLPSHPGRLRAPRLSNFASLLTITYHERPLISQKCGCHLATAFLLFLCFQWLPFGNLGCSAATSPGVTCHYLAGAAGTARCHSDSLADASGMREYQSRNI